MNASSAIAEAQRQADIQRLMQSISNSVYTPRAPAAAAAAAASGAAAGRVMAASSSSVTTVGSQSTAERMSAWIATNRNAGTARAYASGWAGFERFLQQRNLTVNDITQWEVADYLRERVEVQGVAASTMSGDRAAIANHLRFAAPHLKAAPHGDAVTQVMSVLRTVAAPSRPKQHMSAELMRELIQHHDAAGASGAHHAWLPERNLFLMLLMMMAFLRESEAVALTLADVEVKELQDGGLQFPRRVLHVFIARSKTDQERQGAVVLLGMDNWTPASCPVRRFERYMEVRKACGIESQVLFPTVDGKQMSDSTPCGIVQRAVLEANKRSEAAGFGVDRWGDPQSYGSHSLRRGGVTTARANGANMLDIQKHGRWKSLTVFSYVGSTAAEQLAVTRCFLAGTTVVPPSDEVPTLQAQHLRKAGRVSQAVEKKAGAAAAAASGSGKPAGTKGRARRREESSSSSDDDDALEEALFVEAMGQGYNESDDESRKKRDRARRGAKRQAQEKMKAATASAGGQEKKKEKKKARR